MTSPICVCPLHIMVGHPRTGGKDNAAVVTQAGIDPMTTHRPPVTLPLDQGSYPWLMRSDFHSYTYPMLSNGDHSQELRFVYIPKYLITPKS
jgi:hypothetical protein